MFEKFIGENFRKSQADATAVTTDPSTQKNVKEVENKAVAYAIFSEEGRELLWEVLLGKQNKTS